MVTYHSSKVLRKLVRYIEKYYPKVLLIIRPKDTIRNRERGYRSGQPDILIPERKCKHIGLAIWATSKMSKSKTRFLRRLSRVSYETIVSDDIDDLRLCFSMYMAKCDDSVMEDYFYLNMVESLNRSEFVRKPKPLTMSDYECVQQTVKYVRDNYPSAVIIPGLGVDGQPDLIIISPSIVNGGLAIWVSSTYQYIHCQYYGYKSDTIQKLSDNQLDFLRVIGARSYIVILSPSYLRNTRHIDEYMGDKYEYGEYPLILPYIE